MPIYRKADESITEHLQDVMDSYHSRLSQHGVVVDVLAAWPKTDDAGDVIEDAIKHQGYRALAVIKIRGPKERGSGMGDALLIVDAFSWQVLSHEEREALLDHELCHLEVALADDGSVKRDDYERPKLKIRLHDRQFGWFDEVAERHGRASQEVMQAGTLRRVGLVQLYFNEMEPVEA